tara:strand:+ start:71 stop:904 length:834 start_codon:yes stop_codon:yes gene_type:complete
MSGYIYIAENNKDKGKDLYKVGYTTNLKKRRESLNSSGVSGKISWVRTYPFSVEINSLRKIEKRIHNEISRDHPREPDKEWFNCPREIIEEIIEKIDRPKFKIDQWDKDYYENGEFDYLFTSENFSFKELSNFFNSKGWDAYVSGPYPHNLKRAFYIFTYNDLFHEKRELFKSIRSNHNDKEFLDFIKDLQKKIRKINLKEFINNTNSWFPKNLMHLGAAIDLVYYIEKENKILTIEIGGQIKQIINNGDIKFGECLNKGSLEILEKYLRHRRNNRI